MEHDGPPSHLFSDYLEMTALFIMFIIGAPVNLAAYTKLSERTTNSRLDQLKKHLNYADLLVLFVYVPSKGCWLLTYDWRGGDFLCKLVKTMHSFAFQCSSNIIVCIAMDRLLSVLSSSHHSPATAHSRIRIMLLVAWVIAIIVSSPQFFIWEDYLAFEDIGWSQCLPVWEIARIKNTSNEADLFDGESWYSISHIAFIFWIPALIIMACYVVVLSWVWINSRPSLNISTSNLLRSSCTRTTENKVTEWNPLRSILSKNKDTTSQISKDSSKKEKSLSSSDARQPLNPPSTGTNSIPTKGILHNSTSYTANIHRATAIRISFLLVSAYIICWLPYNLLSLAYIIDPKLFKDGISKFYFIHEFMVFNSVINPFLYGILGKPEKKIPEIRLPI